MPEQRTHHIQGRPGTTPRQKGQQSEQHEERSSSRPRANPSQNQRTLSKDHTVTTPTTTNKPTTTRSHHHAEHHYPDQFSLLTSNIPIHRKTDRLTADANFLVVYLTVFVMPTPIHSAPTCAMPAGGLQLGTNSGTHTTTHNRISSSLHSYPSRTLLELHKTHIRWIASPNLRSELRHPPHPGHITLHCTADETCIAPASTNRSKTGCCGLTRAVAVSITSQSPHAGPSAVSQGHSGDVLTTALVKAALHHQVAVQCRPK